MKHVRRWKNSRARTLSILMNFCKFLQLQFWSVLALALPVTLMSKLLDFMLWIILTTLLFAFSRDNKRQYKTYKSICIISMLTWNCENGNKSMIWKRKKVLKINSICSCVPLIFASSFRIFKAIVIQLNEGIKHWELIRNIWFKEFFMVEINLWWKN